MSEQKIIDITAKVDNTEEILKQLENLNSKAKTENGEWVNTSSHGICWQPSMGDRMGRPVEVPSPSTPPPAIEAIVKWGDTIDLDNIPYNSVVMIKLNVNDPMRVNLLQRAIAKQVLEPRIEKLKEKRVCILFMEAGDDISVMTEEEMNKAGWEKKEKSRIITLS